jgi:hypothetical protein
MHPARRRLAFLSAAITAITVVLTVMLPVTMASALASAAAGNGVGIHHPETILPAGVQRPVSAGQGRRGCLPQPRIVAGACFAAEEGSALANASNAAFKAADNAGDWTVSAKHLAGAAGRWAKFAEGTDPNALAQEALRSPDAMFLPNATGSADSFIVRTEVGRIIGTNGPTALRVVVSSDGRIITAFPVK